MSLLWDLWCDLTDPFSGPEDGGEDELEPSTEIKPVGLWEHNKVEMKPPTLVALNRNQLRAEQRERISKLRTADSIETTRAVLRASHGVIRRTAGLSWTSGMINASTSDSTPYWVRL